MRISRVQETPNLSVSSIATTKFFFVSTFYNLGVRARRRQRTFFVKLPYLTTETYTRAFLVSYENLDGIRVV